MLCKAVSSSEKPAIIEERCPAVHFRVDDGNPEWLPAGDLALKGHQPWPFPLLNLLSSNDTLRTMVVGEGTAHCKLELYFLWLCNIKVWWNYGCPPPPLYIF